MKDYPFPIIILAILFSPIVLPILIFTIPFENFKQMKQEELEFSWKLLFHLCNADGPRVTFRHDDGKDKLYECTLCKKVHINNSRLK